MIDLMKEKKEKQPFIPVVTAIHKNKNEDELTLLSSHCKK